MAYLPVAFSTKTFSGFSPISFAPPLAAPFALSVPPVSALRPQPSPLAGAVLSALPQAAGSGGGGSVGYPH